MAAQQKEQKKTPIIIQVPADKPTHRYQSNIIKTNPTSLLVEAPYSEGRLVAAKRNQEVGLVMLMEDKEYTFACRILDIATRPYPLWLLTKPDKPQRVVSRERLYQVEVLQPVIGWFSAKPKNLVPFNMRHVSGSGARLRTSTLPGAVRPLVREEEMMWVKFKLREGEYEVLTRIKGVDRQSTYTELTLEFVGLSQQEREAIVHETFEVQRAQLKQLSEMREEREEAEGPEEPPPAEQPAR
jgi:c-di-GMP-binding flagellar brake protein YcgR